MQKNNIAALGQRVGLTRQEKMRKPGRKLNGREDATLDAPRLPAAAVEAAASACAACMQACD